MSLATLTRRFRLYCDNSADEEDFLCPPPAPVSHHISCWLYFRFPLSFRDVEEMLAERRVQVSYETVCRWILKFGPAIAANCPSSEFLVPEAA